jgi:hypothetical protein
MNSPDSIPPGRGNAGIQILWGLEAGVLHSEGIEYLIIAVSIERLAGNPLDELT